MQICKWKLLFKYFFIKDIWNAQNETINIHVDSQPLYFEMTQDITEGNVHAEEDKKRGYKVQKKGSKEEIIKFRANEGTISNNNGYSNDQPGTHQTS